MVVRTEPEERSVTSTPRHYVLRERSQSQTTELSDTLISGRVISSRVGHAIILPPVDYRSSDAEIFGVQELRTKRVTDLILATLLILCFSPVILIVSLVLLCSGGQLMYRHERVGRFGKKFFCLKFRTMHVNAAADLSRLLERCPDSKHEWESSHKLRNDPRVTKFGQFLRSTSLDEIPQFFNVLRGDMSLVGPRPIVQDEVVKFGSQFRKYASIRPGITGLWQISGRSDLTYRRRVALDVLYKRNMSFGLDLLILLKTVGVVFRRAGAY